MYQTAWIKTEEELKKALDFCYPILGEHLRDMEPYRYEDWKERIPSDLLLYAHADGEVIAAVLGRKENEESLVLGFAACAEAYRMRGITKNLMEQFEENAKRAGFAYITLGSAEESEGFYEKCGYSLLTVMHGQKIYQKKLTAE